VKAKARNRKKSDLDDSNAQRFFAEGEARPPLDSQRPGGEVDPSAFGLPSERQAAFKRYVYILVGVCAVVLVLGLARNALTPPPPPQTHSAPAPSVAAPSIPPPPPEPVAAAPQPATPTPAAAPVASGAVPAASGVAVPADSSVAAAAPVSTKTETQERDDARRLLERGKAKDAAEAAARATALDPTDGDAWLLLGAADMEIGKSADARDAFTQCVKQGKRGEIGECRSMLH
jgi:tetratricopeptide (TPR) repeat protein